MADGREGIFVFSDTAFGELFMLQWITPLPWLNPGGQKADMSHECGTETWCEKVGDNGDMRRLVTDRGPCV